MLVAPGEQENEGHADTNRAVRHIEGGKTGFVAAALQQIESQEIHHVLPQNPVREVPHDAADDEAEGELSQQRMRVEVVPAEKQDDERGDGDEGQPVVFARERAPGSAGVLPMNEFEESGQHGAFVPDVRQVMQHDGLGDLVDGKDNERQRRDAAVGRAQERTNWVHADEG